MKKIIKIWNRQITWAFQNTSDFLKTTTMPPKAWNTRSKHSSNIEPGSKYVNNAGKY